MVHARLYFIAVCILAVLALFAYLILWRPIIFTSNVIIDGDYSVGRRAVVMKGGATLTVKGSLTVNGYLGCKDGGLEVTVVGDFVLNDTIACQRVVSDDASAIAPQGVALVVGGSAEFQSNSVVASNGHVQIVPTAEDLLTEQELDQAFDEIGEDSGDEPRIGPLGSLGKDSVPDQGTQTRSKPVSTLNHLPTQILPGKSSLIARVRAQGPIQRILIGGTLYVGSRDKPLPKWIDVKKLPKKVKRVVVRAYFPNGDVEFRDKSVILSPDGQDGPDITGGCDINVPKQESEADRKARDAMRMRVMARNITIGELDLYLGDGGRGGNATTDPDCDPIGKAIAGHGGQSGNFKMNTATGGALKIRGPFRIHPGVSGAGGAATAYGRDGKNGEIGENGKAAIAAGGNGADNIKALRARGIADLQNIYIDSLIAGDGGDGIASPGDGGDSSKCDTKGGLPGAGGASGGAGGTARLDYPLQVRDIPSAVDQDGLDGNPIIDDANPGADGPPCAGGDGRVPDKTSVTEPTKTPSKTDGGSSSGNDAVKTPTPAPTPPTPTVVKALGKFEFLDSQFQPIINLPTSSQVAVHIIVASTGGNPDIRLYLPITLELKSDGQVVWTGTIANDPVLNCRGADGCSMDGPTISAAWIKKQLKATGKNGEILATYSEQ